MSTQNTFDKVIESVKRGDDVYSLERFGKMFTILKNGKSLKLVVDEDDALRQFKKYRNPIPEGGENMSGYEKAKETAEKLKAEVAAKAEAEEKAVAEVKSQLALVESNSNLAAMYNESASVGAENIGGQSLPILRIHAAGKSTNNELEDGSEPLDGSFYYKPTKEDLGNTVDVRILTISRGWKSAPMEGSEKEYTFNQLVGGIIGNDKPFIMYFNGSKLQNLWNFGKEAGQYTRRKNMKIPMFALSVRLTTKKGEKGKYAAPWIVDFKILRDEDQQPLLTLADEGEFQYIKDNVAVMEETIANVIAAKELKSAVATTPITGEAIERATEAEEVDYQEPDDIPFGTQPTT